MAAIAVILCSGILSLPFFFACLCFLLYWHTMLYCLEDYPVNYGQFTQMCVDRFLTWQIGLWEESRSTAPVKFVPACEEERELISKLRCLNRRVSRGNRVGRSVRIKELESFIRNGRRKQPVSDPVRVPKNENSDGQWLQA